MRGNQDDQGVGWGACERSVCLTTRKISDSFIFRQLEKKTLTHTYYYDFSKKSDDLKH